MFKRCLENRIIIHNEKDYKCYLCHLTMKQSSFDIVKKHLLSDTHQQKLNQIDEEQRKKESDKLLELTGPERKTIVENFITFDRTDHFLNCKVCKCKIHGLSNTLEHINGSSHKKNFKHFIDGNYIQKTKKDSSTEIIVKKKDITPAIVQSKSNDIINNECMSSHYCKICKMGMIATPNISQHTQGSLHQALESSSTCNSNSNCIISDEQSKSYHCKACNKKIVNTPNITEHIDKSLHQTMLGIKKTTNTISVNVNNQELLNQAILRTENTLKLKEVNNSSQAIVLQESSLESHFTEVDYCPTCNVYLKDNSAAQCHVMLHLIIKLKLLKEIDILDCHLSSTNELHLKCLLCHCSYVSNMFKAHDVLEEHIKTKLHLDRLKFFNYTKTDTGLENKDEQINSLNLNTFKYKPVISSSTLCKICDVPLPKNNVQDHARGKSHTRKLRNINGTILEEKRKFDKNNNCYYKCFMCDKSFSSVSMLLEHYKTAEHKWKIEALKMLEECSYTNFIISGIKQIVKCSLCNTIFNDFKGVIDHLSGKKHTEKLKMSSSNLNSQNNINTKSIIQVINKIENLSLNSIKKVQNQENATASVGNKNVSIITTKKLKKIQKTVSNLAATEQELKLLGFGEENIRPVSAIKSAVNVNILDTLVPLDFNNSQIKKLPCLAKSKSHRTPKLDGHRNSFATNVLLNGKHYIKFCIDSGPENVYNFDNEKISIFKLGVSLTFPSQSNRTCLPCEEQFPDDVQSLFEHLQKQEHMHNIYNMQVEDVAFYLEDCPEQFSDLKLAQFFMHALHKGIHCNACNIQIDDDDATIRKHAEDFVHKEKSKIWKKQSDQLFNQYLTIYKDIWYYAEVFFCEICKKKCEFEMDFIKHLIDPEHMKKVYEHKFRKVDLKYDLCPSCITYWFGTSNSYEMHCKSNFHKRFAKNKDFMVPHLTTTASEFLDKIDDNTDLLVHESNKVKVKEETEKETMLLKTIVETVKPAYLDAKTYIFGSRLSHLGFPNSDVDVFLDCENVYYTSSTQEKSQEYIKSVKCYFESSPTTWLVDEVLLASRVPIMKLRHIPTNLKCDISFINGLSVEKSKLVGLYTAFPICRKLILFMKKWLTLCRLFGSDYITTFAISWCVIFYLQLQGVLPTVHQLIERRKRSKIVDGWECGFGDLVTAEKSNVSFKEHLKGFFIYFANFDYQASVICPNLGKIIPKHAFAYSDELPIEMNIYKNRVKNNEVEIFRFDSPLCIQDPIDLSQNMTKAVKKQQLRCFRHYCILSAEKC